MSTEQQAENRNLAYYCKRFSELNVSSSKKRGNAPYQPILLLSIIDLIAQGRIETPQVTVSDDLIQTFQKYWNIFGSSAYQGGLHYPFFALQTQGFWKLKFKTGFDGLQPKTEKKLKEAVEYASLDSQLFYLLQNPVHRAELIDILISVWFSESSKQIEEILQINQTFQDATQLEIVDRDDRPTVALRKSVIRNAFFRKAIVHIYDYKCAFCQLKVIRSLTQNIVDGAHIKPFSEFYNSKIENGISFCKNHHWAFDRGWFTISEDYTIIVAEDLQEEFSYGRIMKDFHGESIELPKSAEYYPSLESLNWHRTNIFNASC